MLKQRSCLTNISNIMESSDGPANKRQRTEINKVQAKDVISFLFVQKHELSQLSLASVLENAKKYQVEHTYQQFGDEMIYGYTDLNIAVIFCLDSFHVFIDVTFSQKSDHPNTTDLHHAFADAFPLGYSTQWSDFITQCASEPDVNFEKINFQGYFESKIGQIRIYQYNRIKAPKDVQSFHERMESLSLFYIEGANFIDSDDDCWEIFIATRNLEDGRVQPVGYMSVFKYFVAPRNCRLEVGHVMIPPFFQNMGIGSAMVQRVNQWAKEIGAVDVTYETPTPQMQILREKMDLQRCWSQEWIQQAIQKVYESMCGGENNQNGIVGNQAPNLKLPKQIQLQMQKQLQISKQQGLKVWEILLWKYLTQQNYKDVEFLVGNVVRKRLIGSDNNNKQTAAQKCFLDRSTVNIDGQKIKTFVMMRCDKVLPSGARLVKAKQEEGLTQQLEAQIENQINVRLNELKFITGANLN
eukprot:TRINITY_DN46943_c0_g2_i1.p1 TRINITY_DN46943_c0_g2~~TRINITY_DN46943_c0_g2_i1.p1  ORF type:complete len:468 (-),score=49.80 TRINITY_DN46943_c0_g2_i1:121-1524(-)